MVMLVYDASWEGFLTAVFEVYERKLIQVSITTSSRSQTGIFGETIHIFTDRIKAERVWAGLKKRVSEQVLYKIFSCHLSEQPGVEDHLLEFIKIILITKGGEEAYGNASVLKISQVAKMVYREKHRMEAFIRFQLTKDGIYYAVIEPDFNVIPLISSHFEKRYADQKWLIFDVKRNYGVFYDLEKVEEVSFEPSSTKLNAIFYEDEEKYQSLWRGYFKHVNIPERRNMKLHLRHVPKRYWKHLTEKLD